MIFSKAGLALRTTSACSNCRLSVLRTFTSLADSSGILQKPPTRQTRIFHISNTLTTKYTTASQPTSAEEIPTSESIDGTVLETKETLPWYLQVDTAKKAPEFLLERQRIPELPEDPPKILEPLLQQLSIDLGLDYLTILDLRKLDPPAALGSNLLMMIGTARSEKHLHTSADRLCRWLRSNYKLRPDADGLLGRDERKLKLRRKVRRAKLLGNGLDDNGDDGIRTGWICVNVGVVEKASEGGEAARQDNFVGFGQRSDGVKLVIQMLTEEKREEIDLESLWNGILKRTDTVDVLAEDPPEMIEARES